MAIEYSQLSDKELWASLQTGSHEAFEEIYNRYWQRLYVHAFKMLKDESEAADLIQDLFISLWEKRSDLDIKLTISSYLFTSVRNRVINATDHHHIRDKYTESLVIFAEKHYSAVEETIIEAELSRLIDREVDRLPGKMKVVFELSRNQEWSHKEIAGHLGMSDKTVKKQIHNALKILKVRLAGMLVKATIMGFHLF
jgi:RNA polymerase sigma-70 factor (ECF subfamily)